MNIYALKDRRPSAITDERHHGVPDILQFVLQVDVAVLTSSRGCHGVGSVESAGPKAQASPFALVELRALWETLRECWPRDWNALLAGTLFCSLQSQQMGRHATHHKHDLRQGRLHVLLSVALKFSRAAELLHLEDKFCRQ